MSIEANIVPICAAHSTTTATKRDFTWIKLETENTKMYYHILNQSFYIIFQHFSKIFDTKINIIKICIITKLTTS